MRRLTWTSFKREYVFAYRWSVKRIPPAAWIASLGFLPGSPLMDAIRALPPAFHELGDGAE